ncbi:MAG: RecB-like helicase [Sulfurospirillum sp.]|nr:RecB-like helicase [Sulfurospirillum sp.]
MSELKPFLALHASAGSGKTYALSVRYISLLFLGANPNKILTLTFTNKAASEMKNRIYKTLKNLENSSELEKICLQTAKSKEQILALQKEVLQKFLTQDLLICTLDAFFASILRKFSLHVGLMPDFKIDVSLYEEDFLERFLATCKREGKYDSLVALSFNEEKKLRDIFVTLENFYAKEGEFDASAAKQHDYKNPQKVLDICNQLQESLQKASVSQRGVESFNNPDIAKLLSRSFLAYESLEENRLYKKYMTPQIKQLYADLRDELLSFINAREQYILGELAALYNIYKQSRKAYNKEFSLLAFGDVSSLVYTLLQDEISQEFLYFRLDGAVEHILLDEYQDTNILQYKILEPLMREITSGIGAHQHRTLFFVGDIKQSIYRFRGGSKELFDYTMTQFGMQKDFLDTNYRSCKNIVEFVNTIFGTKMRDYEIQKAHVDQEGYVEVVCCEDMSQELIGRITWLLENGVASKDIAVLVHQNKDAQVFRDLLCEHFPNLQVQTEAALKLINIPLIRGILDFLAYLYFQQELFLKNFLVTIGIDWCENVAVSGFDSNKTPLTLISEIIRRFEIFDADLDLIKLLEVASRYDDLESFLFACQKFSDDAKIQDNNGIKILTIHKSKGLEFAHVILVDRLTAPKPNTNPWLFEHDGIALQGIYQRTKNREYFDIDYKNAKEGEANLAYDDTLNMHYVACTRAAQSLIICKKETHSAFEALDLEAMQKGKIEAQKPIEQNDKKILSMQGGFRSFGSQKKGKDALNVHDEALQIAAIEYGLALHYMLEMMVNFQQTSLQNAFESMRNRYAMTLDAKSLDSILQRVSRLVANEYFQKLQCNAKIYKEQPISYGGERKQIDLLLQTQECYTIIDYKSSAHTQEEHILQVKGYKKALTQIQPKRVQAYLCYLKEDSVEFVEVI